MSLVHISETEYELPRSGAMRVPGRVFASEKLLESIRDDPCLEQVTNVACLPGIVSASIAMPDSARGWRPGAEELEGSGDVAVGVVDDPHAVG